MLVAGWTPDDLDAPFSNSIFNLRCEKKSPNQCLTDWIQSPSLASVVDLPRGRRRSKDNHNERVGRVSFFTTESRQREAECLAKKTVGSVLASDWSREATSVLLRRTWETETECVCVSQCLIWAWLEASLRRRTTNYYASKKALRIC